MTMSDPPSGDGNSPDGDQGGSQPSPSPQARPTAPDPAGSPSEKIQRRLDQAHKQAQRPGQPSSSPDNHPQPPEKEDTPHQRRNPNMKAGTKILIGLLLGALIMAIAMWLISRNFANAITAMANPPAPSAVAVLPPPSPPTPTPATADPTPPEPPPVTVPPQPAPVLSEDDAGKTSQCNNTMVGKGAGRWYMVSTSLDSKVTLAARLCVGSGAKFRTAETARIVARTVYIREGGHEASGTIDTKFKLSDFAPGKAYANVIETVNGSEKSYNFENPYIVFIDEGNAFDFCDQYKAMKSPPKGDLVGREIWSRCQLGGAHNRAVAQTMAWASRDDMAAANADIHKLKRMVDELDQKVVTTPIPPKQVDFSAAGPSR